jgi:hypothetical protein
MQPIRVTLSGLVPVVNGSQYTFEFYVDVNVLANFSDVYPGGIPFQDGQAVPTADLDFNAHIIPANGIYDPSFAAAFQLFPNPAPGHFQVNTGLEQFEGTLEILGSNGQLIRKQELTGPANTISVAELPAGMYFIRIISGEHSASFKITNE